MTNGGEDTVVPPEDQASPFVEAARESGMPVTYLYYPDEPHDYRQSANWDSFMAVAERFLAQHLGGQYEPYGDSLAGDTSMEVIAGAEHIPGLDEALQQAL